MAASGPCGGYWGYFNWAIIPTGVYEGHVCGGQGKVGLQHLLV